MIVDTSAIMAIVLGEPEAEDLTRVMAAAGRLAMSVGNWIELEAVMTRRGNPEIARDVARLLETFAVALVPVSLSQAGIAREAYRTFGRGTRHPAELNFGDCFAYALAKELGEPLLFKGENFARTDVAAAI